MQKRVLWNIMEKKYKLEYYDNEEKTDLCLIGEQNDLPFKKFIRPSRSPYNTDKYTNEK